MNEKKMQLLRSCQNDGIHVSQPYYSLKIISFNHQKNMKKTWKSSNSIFDQIINFNFSFLLIFISLVSNINGHARHISPHKKLFSLWNTVQGGRGKTSLLITLAFRALPVSSLDGLNRWESSIIVYGKNWNFLRFTFYHWNFF